MQQPQLSCQILTFKIVNFTIEDEIYHLKVKYYLAYCLLNLKYVICTVFSDTFLKEVEPVNTSGEHFLLVFNIKKRRFYLFSFG